jgi:hypothetical protein
MRTTLTALAFVLLALPAAAQTGPCPTVGSVSVIAVGGTIHACVTPSTDPVGGHNAIDPDSLLPVVTSYDIVLLNDGDPVTGTAQATIPVGKPPLNTNGVFWVVLPNAAVPINRRFRASVVANAQPGTAASPRSTLSNVFIVKNPRIPAQPAGVVVP